MQHEILVTANALRQRVYGCQERVFEVEGGFNLKELVAIKPDGGVQWGTHVILQSYPYRFHLWQV